MNKHDLLLRESERAVFGITMKRKVEESFLLPTNIILYFVLLSTCII